jgi:hypothetical protein
MLDSKGKDALKRIVMFRNVFVPIPKPSPSASPLFGGTRDLRAPDLLLPVEIRTDVGAAPAASLGAAANRGCGKVGRPPSGQIKSD